jgi:hypothetical protein
MKKSIAALLMTMVIVGAAPANDTTTLIQEGKGLIKAFAKDLKTALVAAMKEGGPVKAISVCKKIAPEVANTHSKKNGWTIGRTSLKVRNSKSAPDVWESAVLKEFESRKAKGEDISKLIKAEVVERKDGKEFRMMVAIPVAKVCTRCHGTKISKPVTDVLDKLYPDDKARGFKEGDLRGAFTLKKAL